MSSPVNQETASNNYMTQHYSTNIGVVPHNNPIVYPAMTAQYPPLGHHVQGVSNFQPAWTITMPQTSCLSFYEAFLKGQPKALGILVIIVAIVEIVLGIMSCLLAIYSITFYSFTSFWCPVFYIIAGSLTVAAQSKPNICLVQGSLAMNIISGLFSFSAMVINACDLAYNPCLYYYGSSYNNYGYSNYYRERCRLYSTYGIAVISLLLVANALMFFVTVSTSIFGCISMSKLNSTLPQQLMIRNDGAFAMNPGAVPVTAGTYGQPVEPPQPFPAYNNKAVPIHY